MAEFNQTTSVTSKMFLFPASYETAVFDTIIVTCEMDEKYE
jgi:hypothetical protein